MLLFLIIILYNYPTARGRIQVFCSALSYVYNIPYHTSAETANQPLTDVCEEWLWDSSDHEPISVSVNEVNNNLLLSHTCHLLQFFLDMSGMLCYTCHVKTTYDSS